MARSIQLWEYIKAQLRWDNCHLHTVDKVRANLPPEPKYVLRNPIAYIVPAHLD